MIQHASPGNDPDHRIFTDLAFTIEQMTFILLEHSVLLGKASSDFAAVAGTISGAEVVFGS